MFNEAIDEICMPLNNAELHVRSVQKKALNDYLAEIFIVFRLQKSHLQ
jgi:hypothetical protein